MRDVEVVNLEVEFDEIEDTDEELDRRLTSGYSFYLENREMIEAFERYTLGSNHRKIPSRRTSAVEIPKDDDSFELDLFTNPRISA